MWLLLFFLSRRGNERKAEQPAWGSVRLYPLSPARLPPPKAATGSASLLTHPVKLPASFSSPAMTTTTHGTLTSLLCDHVL